MILNNPTPVILYRFGTLPGRVQTLHRAKQAYNTLLGLFRTLYCLSTDAFGCHPECWDDISFLSPARVCLSRTIVITPWVFFQLETSRTSIHPDISRHVPFCVHAKSMSSQNDIPGTISNLQPMGRGAMPAHPCRPTLSIEIPFPMEDAQDTHLATLAHAMTHSCATG